MEKIKVGDKVKLYQYNITKDGEVEVQVVYKYLVQREVYSSLDTYRDEIQFADEKTTRFGTYVIKLQYSKIGAFDFLGRPAKNHYAWPEFVSLENTEKTFKDFKEKAIRCLEQARVQRILDHDKIYYDLPKLSEDSYYKDILKRMENLKTCKEAKLVPTKKVIHSC